MKEANISYFPPVFHMSDVIMASPEASMHWRKDLSQLHLFSSTSWFQHSWRECLASRGGFTCLSTCGPLLLLNLPISYGWGTLQSCSRRWWWQGYRQKRLLAQRGWTEQREDIPTLPLQNKSTGPSWYTEKRQIPVGSIPSSLLGNDVARQGFPGEQMEIQLCA